MIALAAMLGFCGVVFEFLFAQTLSVLFGQTAIQYSVAIGLFLAGMGLGSHLLSSHPHPRRALGYLQVLLALGVPLGLFSIWTLALTGHSWLARGLGYGLCFTVGGLTGGELPLLLRLHSRVGLILASDYFGMLIACAVFPLFLLPELGLFRTLFLVASLNAFAALLLKPERWPHLSPTLGMLAAGFLYEPLIRQWLGHAWLGG